MNELLKVILIVIAVAIAISFVAATLSQCVYLNSIVLIGTGVYLAFVSFQVYGTITTEKYWDIVSRIIVCVYILVVFVPAEIDRIQSPSGQLFMFVFRRGFIMQAIYSLIATGVGVTIICIIADEFHDTLGFKIFGIFGVLGAIGGLVDLGPSTATIIELRKRD